MLTATGLTLLNGSSAELNSCRHRQPSLPDVSTEPQPFHAIPGDTGTQRHTDKHRYTERERQTDRQTEENTRKQPLPLVCLSQGSKKPGFWGFFLKKPNPVGL